MSFSAEWLALREPVDHRSRNPALAARLHRHFALKDTIRVMDIGCGTGSNLRQTYALLPLRQEWRLVDHDSALLDAARHCLCGWADQFEQKGAFLHLHKGQYRLFLRFEQADLATDMERVLEQPVDLVTAAALFDLISDAWIARFATQLAWKKTAFYTVITYDGRDTFWPGHPQDETITAAFSRHQQQDKGFGIAAGPKGADILAHCFKNAGFEVEEGDSPWCLGAEDHVLARALLAGIASAVREIDVLSDSDINDWLSFRQQSLLLPQARMLTGHRDTLALSPET